MPPATPAVRLAPVEVEPQVRVRRSALALAVSVTLASVPILVVDNLPATAAPAKAVEVTSSAAESSTSKAALSDLTTTTSEAPTTTTEAPTTTAAPSTTTSSTAPVVQALRAPAPTTTAPPPPPTTTTAPPRTDPNDPATWDRLARCESDGNWQANTGNGYYGGLQFSLASWQDVGGSGYPHEHSREEQIHRGKILQARYGWGQWPRCSEALGYR